MSNKNKNEKTIKLSSHQENADTHETEEVVFVFVISSIVSWETVECRISLHAHSFKNKCNRVWTKQSRARRIQSKQIMKNI